jgi:16S rRNA (guanine527-N7)-methyltransferase
VFHVKHDRSHPLNPAPDLSRLDAPRLALIDAYVALLLRWNRRINLIGEASDETIRQRHIADCLQLIALLPPGEGAVADLGAGAGLPGLVLAIATGRPMHLIESDRRKAAFLTEATARLGLAGVRIHATRIEDATLPPLAVVTARALAPLERLLPYAARLLSPDGVAIFPKGRGADAELHTAQAGWTFLAEHFPSRTDPAATIYRISDIRRASAQS